MIPEEGNVLTQERPASESAASASGAAATSPAEAAATGAGETPAVQSLPPGCVERSGYALDWGQVKVKLAGGQFVHLLRRPTAAELVERDEDLQTEIQIGKDMSIAMPDPTATEDVDAAIWDKIVLGTEGYPDGASIPAAHKSAAFNGLYRRSIAVAEGADIFAPQVPVVEEIGDGDEPDHTIVHTLRQPTEAELKGIRRRAAAAEMRPGKRGKQILVSKSTLKSDIATYELLCVGISGARLDADPAADLGALKAAVDALVKRQVVQALVNKITGSLLD